MYSRGKAIAEALAGKLDGHLAPHAGIAGPVHLAHTARASRRDDLIRAEFVTCRERHMRDAAEFIQLESGLGMPTRAGTGSDET